MVEFIRRNENAGGLIPLSAAKAGSNQYLVEYYSYFYIGFYRM